MKKQYFATVYHGEPFKILRIEARETQKQAHDSAYGLEKFLVSVGQSKRNLRQISTYTLEEARRRWPAEVAEYEAGCSWYTMNILTGETSEKRQGLKPLENDHG
jgi:hypothetical protein